MDNQPDRPDVPRPSYEVDPRVLAATRRSPNPRLLSILAVAEHVILYLVSFVLLAVGIGILVLMSSTVLKSGVPGTEKVVVVLEELLLVLIVLEIFVTVQTHLMGGRLQLEPFIIVGIIAIVRHILSVVVRLTIPSTLAQGREQIVELAGYAGAAFLLVAALALARWSQQGAAVRGDEPG